MKLPNVIFLDFDGVVCVPKTCIAMGDNGIYSYLDPIACALLKKLCESTNSKIVISSSWRLHKGRNLDFFQSILGAVCPGLGHYVWNSEVDWRTVSATFSNEEDYHPNRGKEIKEWIDKNSALFNNFVILDDDSDMEPLMSSFVMCDCYDGFGLQNYLDAKRILTQEPL